MKYFFFALLMLCACVNRSLNKGELIQKSQHEPTVSKGLTVLEAYQKTTTNGKESADGKHTSTAYTLILLKDDTIKIEQVYLFGEQMEFESYPYEGKFYIVVQVFPEAKDRIKGLMIQTESAFDVFYSEGGVGKVLGVPNILMKDTIQGE